MTSEQATGRQQEAKRFENARQYKWPDCGGEAHFMGLDFKAPKRSDIKAWQAAEEFIRSGRLCYRQRSR